ncbi:hypothetical protein K7711_36525 [Nocardia sp. CA2R105]|uniref:hypothetical protein n=1 Tax=Nocardia coffeae TaxID=2873381 RepID=UPI001CA67E33|nr:hypothetical protein [Nocardia coffeae]MBY8862030.1 hypothetical protein [Nocardia coffeae]
MNEPNRVQQRVLRAVTTQAMEAGKLANSAVVRPGESGPDEARRIAHERSVHRCEQLRIAAIAGGVPQEWIAQTHHRGQLGMAWRPDIHWREHEPINRARLLADLHSDMRHVQDIAVVAAAYGHRGARVEAGTSQLFARNLNTLGRRVAAIAHVLGVTAAEAEQLWGRQDQWTAAATAVRGLSQDTLLGRWREHARLDTREAALQVSGLEDAGIGVATAKNPAPMVKDMVARLGHLLHHPTADPGQGPCPERHVTFSATDGAQIAASIDATNLAAATPVFRSAADPLPEFSDSTPDTGVEP